MDTEKMLEKNCGKLIYDCSDAELYAGLLKTVKELKSEAKERPVKKKLYYISAEFLIGRLLICNLISLGIYDEVREILAKYDRDLTEIAELESEPSLGNGGLGRLAACFLDSLSHIGLAGDGVGILYHYGLFRQVFKDNKQTEEKNPWISDSKILEKTDITYNVKFKDCELRAQLYTIDVLGKGRNNKLKLFDLVNASEDAVTDGILYDKRDIERNLTLFLYPDDSDYDGKRLRLCQEYFMASCAAQLIIDESERKGSNLKDLYDYAVVQINDTHPSLIIPEMIRLLREHGFCMDTAIKTVMKTCAYTNHTILSEALETWPMKLLEDTIPDIANIIKELSMRIKDKFSDKSVQIIDDKDNVHMASIDIHYGFCVNGVASLHTKILKETELNGFYKLYPEKFRNKTNGISMRRWLIAANPALYDYIVSLIGDGFTDDYEKLKDLLKYQNDKTVLDTLIRIKRENKARLGYDCDSVFDVQIKRLHEYKRQQMNVLYFINKYLEIKNGKIPKRPITAIFGAKAAGAYTIAKDIIHLILCMQEIVSNDGDVSKHLKISMVENYNVSWAEKIIPASDISEQISLASKEASGTGNMKLMLNGAVTLGTRDGANVEIEKLVGDKNIYIFGDESDTVIERYKNGNYNACKYYESDKDIKRAVDFITSDAMLRAGDESSLRRLQNELIRKDYFMTFPDFHDYVKTKERMFDDYENREDWAKKMLVNIAMSGYFSSDRTIREYNEEIWGLQI